MTSHRQQMRICESGGLTTGSVFKSFKEHPEFLPNPLFMSKEKFKRLLEAGGVSLIECGRFGGICSSGHPECQKMRGTHSDTSLHTV